MMNARQQNIDKNRKESIETLKAAVRSFRIVELKECLKMFSLHPSSMRKAELQKQVLITIDGLKYTESNIPLKCFMKIMELQKRLTNKLDRRRRRVTISWRKQSVYGESPFFITVQVLEKFEALRSHCCMSLSILPKIAQLLRKKKSGKDLFTHEIQFQFRTEEKNDMWMPKTIRLKMNGKNLELRDSPPIIYLTQYCLILKNVLNKIEVELPDNVQNLTLVVSVVKRFSPSQLQDICPVKEVSKIRNLLENHFDDTGEHIYNVTLVCPLGRKTMSSPCRGSFCKHPDVFDLQLFLEKMQYFLFWKCPICECPITYKTLEIESFFKNFLDQGKLNFTFYKKKRDFNGPCSEEVITLD